MLASNGGADPGFGALCHVASHFPFLSPLLHLLCTLSEEGHTHMPFHWCPQVSRLLQLQLVSTGSRGSWVAPRVGPAWILVSPPPSTTSVSSPVTWMDRDAYLFAPGTNLIDGGDIVSPPPSPPPRMAAVPVSVPPALVSGILGRRQCQSAGSASLATDLQSTQAVKAT